MDIYVVSAGAGPRRRLTTDRVEDAVPNWSLDGKWIYFASNRGGGLQVWKIASDGGRPEPVTRQGGFTAFESTDDFIYYVKTRARGSIWRISVGGGEEELVAQSLPPILCSDWAVLKRGIYFINRQATPHPAIEFYSFTPREVTPITTLIDYGGWGLTVSVDGQRFFYTRADKRGSDIMLVENFRQDTADVEREVTATQACIDLRRRGMGISFARYRELTSPI